ncbi:MAG: hypothetical protein HY606_13905 [Planctomycetes bacterium]|nr:hypothetical protein [Planctomycetota bacterium]
MKAILSMVAFLAITVESHTLFLFEEWLTDLNKAQEISQQTLKPILFLITVDAKGIDRMPGNKLSRDLPGLAGDKRKWMSDNFILVISGSQQDALRFGTTHAPTVIFFDPFLNQITSEFCRDFDDLENGGKRALSSFKDSAPFWEEDSLDQIIESNLPEDEYETFTSLLVLCFLDEDGGNSKKTIEILSNKLIVRQHRHLLFIKDKFEENSPNSKQWGIKKEGSFVIIELIGGKKKTNVIKKFDAVPDPKSLYKLIDSTLQKLRQRKEELKEKKKKDEMKNKKKDGNKD